MGGCHGQRMPDKSSRKKSYPGRGRGIITVLPVSTIQCVHISRGTGQHADGHSPSHDFPIGGHIGFDTEIFLGAAGSHPEACDHFVKNQCDFILIG